MDYCFTFSELSGERWLATDARAGVAYKLSRHAMLLLVSLQASETRRSAHARYCVEARSSIDFPAFELAAAQVLEQLRRQARPPRRQLAASMTVVPHWLVDMLAEPLRALVSRPVWILNFTIGVALFAALFAWQGMPALPDTPGAVGTFVVLLLLSALFHELGHASAIKRFGHVVGNFGVGIYWIYPVFYTELLCLDALAVGDRLWVNLAGIHFQLMFSSVVAVLALSLQLPVLGLCSELITLFTVVQLLPLGRSDGYWILLDVSGSWDVRLASFCRIFSGVMTAVLIAFMVRVSIAPLIVAMTRAGGLAPVANIIFKPSSLLVLAQTVLAIIGCRSLLARLPWFKRRSHAA
jgi:hypothetical protein